VNNLSWILVIFMSQALNCTPIDYKTQIGPFDNAESCRNAQKIIGEDVKNANFYCLEVEKTNGL